jgi:aminopeptidase
MSRKRRPWSRSRLPSVADPRVERLADVLVDYSTSVRPGDLVLLETGPLATPLLRELFRRVVSAGANPQLRVALEGAAEALLSSASDDQIEWVNPARREDFERADVRIAVEGDANSRALSGIDPARQARYSRARESLRERYLERSRLGELRTCVTAFPTNASAQDAAMSLEEYEDFVYRAGFLDRDDPVGAWRELGEKLGRLAERLGRTSELRVIGEDTDLTVGVAGRTWIPCDGKENFPDGEVFTGPVESSVEGRIRFTYPATFAGRVVRDIQLEFEDGEVVEAHAASGEDFLREMIAMDDGARRVGEFAFGMNDAVREFTGHTLYDEKIGGTIHLALGMSYPESGGVNQSALHWDLVCDLRSGSEVYADGDLVYRDGAFVPQFL